MSEVSTCRSCGTRVIPMENGNCPACRRPFTEMQPERVAEMQRLEQLQTRPQPSRRGIRGSSFPRPWYLTLVGFFWIVSAVCSLVIRYLLSGLAESGHRAGNDGPIDWFSTGMFLVGTAVMVLCGIGVLDAKRWARTLYTAWGAFGMVVSIFLITNEMPIIWLISLGVYFFSCCILWIPTRSRKYFGDLVIEEIQLIHGT